MNVMQMFCVHWEDAIDREDNTNAQPLRHINPMLVRCWTGVVVGGPTYNKDWVNLLYLLGEHRVQRRAITKATSRNIQDLQNKSHKQ